MERIDALLYSVSFYAYFVSFIIYILHIALNKELLGKVATWIAAFGLLPHTAAIAARWIQQGHVPLANMYEYMGLMAWMVVAGLIAFVIRYRNTRIGVFLIPVAVMLMVTASLLPSDVNRQLMPALQSTWLAIHVSLAALGSGAFLMSFAAAALVLLTAGSEEGNLSRKRAKELKAFSWVEFGTFWIGLPIASWLVMHVTGLLPPEINIAAAGEQMGLFTGFALGKGIGTSLLGGPAIGLGIGMIIATILWPFLHVRLPQKYRGNGMHEFMTVVLALLFSAILIGFAIKSGNITLTPRSYLKIFEFFGPVLVLSWFIVPLVHLVIGVSAVGWLPKIGVARPVLKEIAYSAVAIGYPLYTVGALFAGAIWAEKAWGTWWSWDPKEVGALIIWLFYTVFLHARYQRKWSGDRAAVLIVLGMLFLFVSFFGNYFFGGMHAYS
ncbi:cytochrome c biogenesis protein CcsA [bacterium BMS3Bbin04]|nr:cytochrome c biogenesis protein CcsA [bacterium BMS3Bbin04]